ncbi:hypothetical protein ACFYY1_43165 [Streptomyces sp. NPDC001890]|uniref:hypothetical protein n=1 Tax=Streptomyces sp. NPDC001890 TaxID=3364620 RepID=UPI0036899152
MPTPDTVDLDDPTTWPANLAELIAELIYAVPEGLDAGSDLHNEACELAEYDVQVREMLAGTCYALTTRPDSSTTRSRTCGRSAFLP